MPISCPDCHRLVDESAVYCEHCGYHFLPQTGKLDPSRSEPLEGPLFYNQSDFLADREYGAPSGKEDSIPSSFPASGTCSACGYINLPGEMFCQRCGVQLPPVSSVPPPPPKRAPDPGEAPAAGASAPYVRVGKLYLRPSGVEISLPLGKREIVLGRDDPTLDIYPQIDLTRYDGEQSGVSRRPARIWVDFAGVSIEDLNSTNFTFLNRYRLPPGQRYLLEDGDEIRLGLLVLEYRIEESG